MPVSDNVVTPTGNACTCLCISLFRDAEGRHKKTMVSTSTARTELEPTPTADTSLELPITQDSNANAETLSRTDLDLLPQMPLVDVNSNTNSELSEEQSPCAQERVATVCKNANRSTRLGGGHTHVDGCTSSR